MSATHTCPGCYRSGIADHLFACPTCWRKLPEDIRRAIWTTYRSDDHVAHIRAMTRGLAHFAARQVKAATGQDVDPEEIKPGYRYSDVGGTYEWGGRGWRSVPASELRGEAWRR
jgi:hypothetical protein